MQRVHAQWCAVVVSIDGSGDNTLLFLRIGCLAVLSEVVVVVDEEEEEEEDVCVLHCRNSLSRVSCLRKTAALRSCCVSFIVDY